MRAGSNVKYAISLILILSVSFTISAMVYYIPQNTTTFPITPFMSYYNKYTFVQATNGDFSAQGSGTAITVVWLSNIINSTTIEVSERDIETLLTVPINFTEIKTYQVNLLTGKTNGSREFFLYWTLPFWNILPDLPLPIRVGNTSNYITSEQNLIVLGLIRDTKAAWSFSEDSLSVANFDKSSGALLEYKGRIGNTTEIYQLESTLGINLGVDLTYYSTMVLLFSLIPGIAIFLLYLILDLRKKPEIKKVRPHERGKSQKENQSNPKITEEVK